MRIEEISQAKNDKSGKLPDSFEEHRTFRLGLAYGRWIYRWRWLVLLFWLIVLVVSVPLATRLTKLLTSGGYSFSGSESTQVGNILIDKLHQPPSQATVVFQASNTQVSDPAYQQEIQAFTNKLKTFPHFRSITQGSVGQDGRTIFILINFNADFETMQQYMGNLRNMLPNGSHAGPAQAYLTGGLPVTDELNTLTESDAEVADTEVFPVALLVLLLVFGTFTAAILPLLLTLMAIPISLALLYPLAQHTSISTFIISIVSVVGLGISIDYSLFIVRRFREELASGKKPQEAIAWTIATAGEAILFSGLIVMIGFSGLLLIGINVTTSDAFGGAAVVISAVLVALTLLPTVLSILGQRINSLRLPWLWRLSMRATNASNNDEQGFWHRLALGVMRRPIFVIVLVVIILAALAGPVFALNIGSSSAAILPKDSQAHQGLDILQKEYAGLGVDDNPVDIIVETRNGSNILTADNLNTIAQLDQWLAQQRHITSVTSLMQPPATPGSPAISQQQLIALYTTGAYQQIPGLNQLVTSTTSGNLTWISLNANTRLDSDAGKALINHLRAETGKHSSGLTVLIGGTQATYQDFDNYLYGNFPRTIIFILIITYILLLLMFRSVLIPLKALIMNIISVCAGYGVLVFVFQWGNLSNILGFTSQGFIDSLIPILLFCVLFGLSMDYEVFLLSRIREEWLRTGDNTKAVALGLEKTGGVITNAALLFVIVTVAFTFTRLLPTKEIGVGMTVAILVDATIIRSLLVPATMRLLGRWNWWLPGKPLPPKQA
jgi:putative drug exporter of the RND superfamily